MMAKAAATLDRVSGRALSCSAWATGYLRGEFAAVGVTSTSATPCLTEAIAVLRGGMERRARHPRDGTSTARDRLPARPGAAAAADMERREIRTTGPRQRVVDVGRRMAKDHETGGKGGPPEKRRTGETRAAGRDDRRDPPAAGAGGRRPASTWCTRSERPISGAAPDATLARGP